MICETGLEWKRRVCIRGCVMEHFHCGDLQAHHILTQQQLRKHGLKHLLWDTRNGLPLCDRAHDRHHSAHERIPRDLLPAGALQFAEEVGLMHLIERYYPLRTPLSGVAENPGSQ